MSFFDQFTCETCGWCDLPSSTCRGTTPRAVTVAVKHLATTRNWADGAGSKVEAVDTHEVVGRWPKVALSDWCSCWSAGRVHAGTPLPTAPSEQKPQ